MYCDRVAGCVGAGACSVWTDCDYPDRACVTTTCDGSVCHYTIRDVDGDGYASMECSGFDCDDSDASINPAGTETCNARDDDCDGTYDEDMPTLLCPTHWGSPAVGYTCIAGQCGCAHDECLGPGRYECVDLRTTPEHCGSCENVCASGRACVGGQCVAM